MSNPARTHSVGSATFHAAAKARAGAVESPESYVEQARQTMARLCTALGGLLENLPTHSARATDVANALRINPQLAWQIFRMAGTADSLAAVQFLPTSNQLARVIEAARVAGAKPEAVKNVEAASHALDTFLLQHARDRREFESLIGSLAGGAAEQVDLRHRRALHRGHAHFYGIQARTVYGCSVAYLDKAKEGYRLVSMLGYVGLHTLRPNVPMTLHQKAAALDSGGDPLTATIGPRLLDGFGSGQRIELVPEGEEDGRILTRIVFPGIGRETAVSFLSAQDFHEVVSAQDLEAWMAIQLTVPAEAIVVDILLPAGFDPSGRAVVQTFARRAKPMKVNEYRSVDIVPGNEQAVCTRGVTDLAPTNDAPGAREAVGRLLREKGWWGTKFDHYRCRVAFPALYSSVRLMVLPPNERPSQ
jgi:hypothetical protein